MPKPQFSPIGPHAHEFRVLESYGNSRRCVACGLAEPVTRYPNGLYRHGSVSMYSNFGCRCPRCADTYRRWRAGRYAGSRLV